MLDIENITVAYHGQPFLRDFSLHMKRGEIISLVGESGSGKTTAIRSILGLLPQEGELVSGDILFEGKSLPEYSEKEMQKLRGSRISMIFQDSGAMLNPIRKIGSQYIEYIQKHEKLGHKAAEEKAVAMLEAMRLSEPEGCLPCSHRPTQYPGTAGPVWQRYWKAMVWRLKSLPRVFRYPGNASADKEHRERSELDE